MIHAHTCYSFCYGTMKPEEVIQAVKAAGYTRFLLADINNTSACLDTIRLAPEQGIQPVVGIDFRNGVQPCYVGIARNNNGFKELNSHLTHHLHSGEPFPLQAPAFSDAFVVYPLKTYKGQALSANEFIGVTVNDLRQFMFSPARKQTHKLVVLQQVSFADRRQFNAHRLLRAIDTNTLLSKLSVSEQASGTEMMISEHELFSAFASFPHILTNTANLFNQCSIHFEYGKLSNKNLRHYSGSMAEDMQLLRKYCEEGLHYRYPNPSPDVMLRVQKELDVIEKLQFASYFLINHDIVTYAQHRNFYYVGRGSGANSIVAYLLRITDVDPIELDLYFERFINIHRSNAPDFDMDFSWTDREDITRYIFNRFGYQRTALLGAYNTFQHDAVIRELGKVFGLPPGEIDRLQQAHKYPDIDNLGQQILRYSKLIQGLPSHLSIHSSGILISEDPIMEYSATFMPPKGFPTVQFSMLEAEDIGLYKFDILSQRGLGKIKDALEMVKENRGVSIDVHDAARFKSDEKVKELLREGNAIGCFYVESPAMRMLLAKLRADDYLRLVAASSIIRPGVAKSGMMREYIIRFRDPSLREKAKAQLPQLYELLEETYGVMVYQEDVIRVAHLFAGLTLAEADYLRRGMSWKFKRRDEFNQVKSNFFKNCLAKGYALKTVTDIWNQIESFANFAFSKGHSASYAVESYQALFLKAHYPLEYLTATLNNGGGFYRRELYVHESRMRGAEIMAPCVNLGSGECVVHGNRIVLGLLMISGIEQETIDRILQERNANGLYGDMYDLIRRASPPLEQLRLLIRAGALDFTNRSRKEMLWEAHMFLKPVKNETGNRLFEKTTKHYHLPELIESPVDIAFDQLELFGFTFCSPFEMLREEPPPGLLSRQLKDYIGLEVSVNGYLITVKPTITSKGERMYFGTFIDVEGRWIDTVHFPPSAKQWGFTGSGVYVLKGKVVSEYDFISIEVNYMKRIPMIDRETFVPSSPDTAAM